MQPTDTTHTRNWHCTLTLGRWRMCVVAHCAPIKALLYASAALRNRAAATPPRIRCTASHQSKKVAVPQRTVIEIVGVLCTWDLAESFSSLIVSQRVDSSILTHVVSQKTKLVLQSPVHENARHLFDPRLPRRTIACKFNFVSERIDFEVILKFLAIPIHRLGIEEFLVVALVEELLILGSAQAFVELELRFFFLRLYGLVLEEVLVASLNGHVQFILLSVRQTSQCFLNIFPLSYWQGILWARLACIDVPLTV